MANSTPIINRNGNINALNSEITSEVLYEAPSAGNMSNKPFLMDVSDRGHAEILDELTDLSANKGAYALREVYSNAHDATVRAGDMSRPIEIVIPDIADGVSSLSDKLAMIGSDHGGHDQYAYVTDHGIGMTEYDLRTYFTQYGGSNKRDDIASIGSKGLGSKAPLAVADFFDVTTSKDGTKTSMHLWRAEDGNYAEVTGSEPCPIDETGTTVRIPVTNSTTAQQMLECANEIARYNSDANVIINGNATMSTLNREYGSVSNIDGTNYMSLGPIKIGEDGAGNPVSVPVWLSTKILDAGIMEPWNASNATRARIEYEGGGVRAVLCGIGYQLTETRQTTHQTRYQNGYYYGYSTSQQNPMCITEIEPGYLNFTVSRDDIKDDPRKKAFVDALSKAIDAVNLWPVAIRMSAHNLNALRRLLDGRSLRNVGGSWQITRARVDLMMGIHYTLTDDDIEAFDDYKGRSMLPLLATFDGSDPNGHDAKCLAWFSSAFNGKSARFHVAYPDKERNDSDPTDKNWASDLLGWKHGTDSMHGSKGTNSFSPNIETIYTLVERRIPSSQIASVVRKDFDTSWNLMVIGGVDAKSFSKAEHSIRRHVADAIGSTVLQARILYVLCEGPVSTDPASPYCLSDAELALVDAMDGHTEVTMLDELATRCAKEDRERRKANPKKANRKGPKPLGSYGCQVASIDSSKFADESALVIADEDTDGVPNRKDNTIRWAHIDLDTLGSDDLVVIGCPDDHLITVMAMQAMLLQKMGRLRDGYDRIVFIPSSHDGTNSRKLALYAPQAKRLAKQVTVLADIREDWAVEHIESVMDAAGFITQDGVNIDAANIEPTDMMRVSVATRTLCIGRGGQWLTKNIDPGLDLARLAFGSCEYDKNRFRRPVMAIETADRATVAFTNWMDRVWGFATAYKFSDIINNIDDPSIEAFARSLVGGVIEQATEDYGEEIEGSEADAA